MELLDLRKLRSLSTVDPHRGVPTRVIVFIHGIFSSHETFQHLVDGLKKYQPSLAESGFYYFDYDYHRSIPASGADLAKALIAAFPEQTPHVTLVGHSMGGLVARTALLQEGHNLPMVKRLVMLGTPNHGTLHTARLGLMTHLVREATGVLWTIFARKATGIKELTQIGKTITPLLKDGGAARTHGVEYVTIPGLRFNHESGWLEAPEGTSFALRALMIGFEITKAIPGLKSELELPHDGIVEEDCVRLSSKPAFFSERPSGGSGGPPYLHVTHPDYEHVDHVTVQRADCTIKLLAELLLAVDLESWRKSLAARAEFNLYPP